MVSSSGTFSSPTWPIVRKRKKSSGVFVGSIQCASFAYLPSILGCSEALKCVPSIQRGSKVFYPLKDAQRRSEMLKDVQRRSEMSKKQNTSPKTAWSSGRSSSSPPSPPHSSVSRTASPHSPLLAPYTSFTGCMPTTPICRRSHRSSHSQDAQPQERQLLW